MTSPYPHDPDEHILQMPHKKKRSVVDASYRFESRNPIYRLNAWLLRQVALIVLPIWAKLTMTVGEPIPSTGKTAKALCEETHRVFEKIAQDFYGPEYNPDMEPEADSSCG